MRRSYHAATLDEAGLPADPVDLFVAWVGAATDAGELEPNAMALATVGADGQPRVRFVLLKDASGEGLSFFTNYDSRKGRDLSEVPRASVAFWWPKLERQVRVDGTVSRLPAAASDAYFASRPRGSRIGAWVSHQSTRVSGRGELAEERAAAEAKFGGGDVPRPPYWGGYLLRPERYEFWQGREDRLHDRIEYARLGDHEWRISRLAP